MATLGFVGLGAMGSRLARRLLDARYPVVGYNRTADKAKPLVEAGMRLAASPREVAEASLQRTTMTKDVAVVHHPDRRIDVVMPYAPAIVVRRGNLVFLSGLTAAAVYHSHPHRDEEFDLPATMREQAILGMENLKKTLEAAGCQLSDLVTATRYLTDVN